MAITQAGTTLQFPGLGSGNSGTVSTTITVPADAEFVVVGWSGFSAFANFFSAGSMTFTKGGVDTAMTSAGIGLGDSTAGEWDAAVFYLALPDTGANKTLKWDWSGAGAADAAASLCSITFWKDIDTASPVRDAKAGHGTNTPYTTGTLTALSGDLIVAWVGAADNGSEGTIDSWSNLTLLTQIAKSSDADGAWATGSPTGDTTVAASTDTNIDDGSIVAIVLKPAAAAAAQVPYQPWQHRGPMLAQ